jgi:hypothetical protein
MTMWQFALLQSSIFIAAYLCAPSERSVQGSTCMFIGVGWLAFAVLSVADL